MNNGWSRHSSRPVEESPGLSKILAWRTPARPCQITDSPYLTIIYCLKSAHCLIHERLDGDCLHLQDQSQEIDYILAMGMKRGTDESDVFNCIKIISVGQI